MGYFSYVSPDKQEYSAQGISLMGLRHAARQLDHRSNAEIVATNFAKPDDRSCFERRRFAPSLSRLPSQSFNLSRPKNSVFRSIRHISALVHHSDVDFEHSERYDTFIAPVK